MKNKIIFMFLILAITIYILSTFDYLLYIDKTFKNKDTISLVKVFVFGDVSSFPNSAKKLLKQSGMIHILVISGFHFSIIKNFLRKSLVFFTYEIKEIILFFTITIYVYILYSIKSDITYPILRMYIIQCIYFLSVIMYEKFSETKAILISMVLIIVLFKGEYHEISFILTYLASIGILLFKKFKNPLIFNLFIFFFLSPYLMYAFGKIYPYSIIFLTLLMPVMEILIYTTFFVFLSSIIYPLYIFEKLLSILYTIVLNILNFVPKLPFSTIYIRLSLFQMICIYTLISLIYTFLNRKNIKKMLK